MGISLQRPRPRRSARRGFSLIELMVVIAVAAAMMAIVIPFGQDADIVGNEARRLLSDALRLRSTARTTWNATILSFDVDGGRWKCENSDGSPIPGPDADANGWREFNDRSAFLSTVAGKNSTFVFLPNGRILNDSAIEIRAGDAIWRVEANTISGKIDSYRFN